MIKHTTAIILAAGMGKRMNYPIPKQYRYVQDHPVIYHTIKAFQDSSIIKDIILVCGKNEVESCQKSVVEKYAFDKVIAVVAGGKERYHSVRAGLEQLCEDTQYVMIHDCARPVVTQDLLKRGYESVLQHDATIPVLPVKDTIKKIDPQGTVIGTPNRDQLYIVQTPQIFTKKLITQAYGDLFRVLQQETGQNKHAKCEENQGYKQVIEEKTNITDDAMVVETFTDKKVHTYLGDYYNIKITTPEDMELVKLYLFCLDNVHS